MRVLAWHVHGSWMTAFVEGQQTTLVPVLPDRGPDGRGRARTWDWPSRVVERSPAELRNEEVDVVILQRPEELGLATEWLGGRVPGRDIPLVYLEHNCPQGRIAEMRHPFADRADVVLVHVTHFNALFWDSGSTRTRVILHGVPDPGRRYTGAVERAAVVVNEAKRRGRVTGTDLLQRLAERTPIDLFGMGASEAVTALSASSPSRPGASPPSIGDGPVRAFDDLAQGELHEAMALRRVYLHPFRWTSLGLSLIEAMMLGMPVAALATTEVVEAVPPSAGIVTNDLERLCEGIALLNADRERAAAAGRVARAAAIQRYRIERFLDEWDALLKEVIA